jgi:hypothetical protein
MATPAGAAAEADWEASKENFQPLKTGRKATALRDSTAELRGQAIEAQRRWENLPLAVARHALSMFSRPSAPILVVHLLKIAL